MTAAELVPFPDRYVPLDPPEAILAAFHDVLRRRRSVREFADRTVDRATIEWLVRCAHRAPSGANKQPWRFVCVQDQSIKQRIRSAAEQEEREFYARRANPEWLADLAPLGTDPTKEFLTTAPWLIVVFQLTELDDGGQVYYLKEKRTTSGKRCQPSTTASAGKGLRLPGEESASRQNAVAGSSAGDKTGDDR